MSFAALHRAQELVEDPMGEQDTEIEAREFTPEETHQAAVKLAQEASKAVAHCCLAFMALPPSREESQAAAPGHNAAGNPGH